MTIHLLLHAPPTPTHRLASPYAGTCSTSRLLRISDLCVQFLEQNQFIRQSCSRSMSCSKQYLYSIVPGVCQPVKSNCDWVVDSRLALPDLLQPTLPSEVGLRRGGAEQFVCFSLVVGNRRHCQVSVLETLRIMLDAKIDSPQPQVQPTPPHQFRCGFAEVLRIEAPGRLDREAGAPVASDLTSKETTFERVDLLEIHAALEPCDQEQSIACVGSH